MTTVVEGFVNEIVTKSGEGKRGPWTLYKLRIQNADGSMDPNFYFYSFNKAPKFKCDETTEGSGDYIRFEAKKADKGGEQAWDVVEGSGKVVKNPPARVKAEPTTRPKAGSKTDPLFGEVGGYTSIDDVRRISLNAAQDRAVRTVIGCLAENALPVPKNKGRDVQFDLVLDLIDKLTVRFFYDTVTGRQLENVQDPGAVQVKNVAPLPDDADEEEETPAPEAPEGIEDPDADGDF